MISIKLEHGQYTYDPATPLGRAGGFGQVFLGSTSEGRELAIKKLHLGVAEAAHREIRIAQELRGRTYQHVLGFVDAGEDAETGEYFVVMQKAQECLQAYLKERGRLAPPAVASILLEIAMGLAEVHELIHRDLKPDNILLHEGKWKVADFGIARFVEERTASNTLKDCLSHHYAAPEQWRGISATHATDICALGCIGFALLTGVPPFTINPQEQHLNEPVPPFECDDYKLSSLIQTMMRKLLEVRPNIARVIHALEESIQSHSKAKSEASSLLAHAGSVLAQEEAEQAARKDKEIRNKRDRSELASVGRQILAENLGRLWTSIESAAPIAHKLSEAPNLQVKLGAGILIFHYLTDKAIDPGEFKRSNWDVVAAAQLMVHQATPKYQWASSLWYGKREAHQGYRWFEVGYYTLAHGGGAEPFAVTTIRDADLAFSNTIHSISIAYGPWPIDDECEISFHERISVLLARAARRELCRPRSLPLTEWPK